MEKLDRVEGVVRQEPCVYCSQLDCINVEKIVNTKFDSLEVALFCTNCLRARLVREIKLLRITGQ